MFPVKLSFCRTLIFSWLRIKHPPNFMPRAISHDAAVLIYWNEIYLQVSTTEFKLVFFCTVPVKNEAGDFMR